MRIFISIIKFISVCIRRFRRFLFSLCVLIVVFINNCFLYKLEIRIFSNGEDLEEYGV